MDELPKDLLLMDGFDEALVGFVNRFGSEPVACYSFSKVIDILVKQGMSLVEAVEFHEFNQLGAFVGEQTPCFLHTREIQKDGDER